MKNVSTAFVLAALSALLVVSCSTTISKPPPPERGARLREYRQLVLDCQKLITQAREATEALAFEKGVNLSKGFTQFDEAVHQLDVRSLTTRARADAMEARGQAYFQEWEAGLAATNNAAAEQRMKELKGHFENVLDGSKQLRAQFRQFMTGLREVQTKLGLHPTEGAVRNARLAFAQSADAGKKTEQAVAELLERLAAAETALMTGEAPPPPKD